MLSLIAASALFQGTPAVADFVRTLGVPRREGLLGSYIDRKDARIYLEIPAANPGTGLAGEYLYTESLRSGLGSNDLLLDRGQTGDAMVIRLRPVGQRVLVERPNLTFRASSRDLDEQRAVEESFAYSVLASMPIKARDTDGKCLVDATDFVVRDAHGTASQIKGYALDRDRSAPALEQCKAFPLNLEFEARLTFSTNGEPNPNVAAVSPDPRSATVVQHHSLVQLPPAGYRPRKFDPRAGAWSMSVFDFSAPLGQSLRKRYIMRHRLEKTDPNAEASPVRKPIVYYVDRGAPEPVRTALLEGARYWEKAFEKAGLLGAFKVELLPADADPEDLRYNVIQWVHRSTRGYSYGASVVDPRTGEILKGKVSLDSSRGHHDVMLFEGLIGAKKTGSGAPDDPVRLALERLRQLAAHEVGHTLGFAHNFGSSVDDRASVMDYPAPKVTVRDGRLDLSEAYAPGVGAWDEFTVKYAYTDVPAERETETLTSILSSAASLTFLTDMDADETSGSDPRAVRFDNGTDPVAGLRAALEVRKLALGRFGPENVAPGEPQSRLEEVLGPVYFYHRYAVDSALRMVGGLTYRHTVSGDPTGAVTAVPGDRQRAALATLLDAAQPAAIDLPPTLLKWLPPRTFGAESSRETFGSSTRYAFDSIGAAGTAADLVIGRLLDPARCHRVVELSTRDASLPKLEEVLTTVVRQTFWVPAPESSRERELRQTVQDVVLDRLMDLADRGSSSVRYRARNTLNDILSRIQSSDSARSRDVAAEIRRYLSRPADTAPRRPYAPPVVPGAPIGMCGMGDH